MLHANKSGAAASPNDDIRSRPTVRTTTAATVRGAIDALHLAELVAPVRAQLAIPGIVTDADILQSLEAIVAHSDRRARWRVAFDAPLTRALAARGCDLNTTIGTLLSLLPKPVS
jgi:hypothetical protein